MSNAQKKIVSASVKAMSKSGEATADAPYGWVEGVANAYEVDRQGDLVLPTALAASFEKFMLNPVMTFGHGMDGNPQNGTLPAGSIISLKQDTSGNTHFKARWANTPDAQLVRGMYNDGDMRAFSIHFLPGGNSLESRMPTAEEVKRYPGVQRVITKLELIEIACAVVPVNAGSLATGSKTFNGQASIGLSSPPKLGAKAMGKTILTSEHRKAIATATKAYEKHVKAMEGVKSALEDLSDDKDGTEADHSAMSDKCMKAMDNMIDSHKELSESITAAHKSITNAKDELEENNEADGEGLDEGGDAIKAMSLSPEETKALNDSFDQGFKSIK